MKKRFTLFSGMLLLMAATMSAIQSATPFLEEPGDGEASTWARQSVSVVNIMGLDLSSIDYGGAVNMVTAPDGTVWIDYFLSGFRTNGWTVGKIDGDRLTVALPQEIYREDGVPYYLAVVNKSAIDDSFSLGSETEAVFTKEGNVWKSNLTTANKILGLVSPSGDFTGAGDYSLQFTAYTIPEEGNDDGVEYKDYSFISGQSGHIVQIGTKDNQLYLKGLLESCPDNFITATIDDDFVSFKSGQYLGIRDEEGYTPHYNFLMSVTETTGEKFVGLETLEFIWNRETGTMESEGAFVYNHSPKTPFINFIKLCENPRFVLRNESGKLIPDNPTSVILNKGKNEKSVVAIIPQLATDGTLLDAEQLYYRLYIDGEPFTFYQDEYKYLDMEEMTDVPYNYTEQYDFMVNGAYHEVYLYMADVNVVGVQSVYFGDGYETVSDIVNSDGTVISAHGSVNAVNAEGVAAEYYDLHGRKVSRDYKGIVIRRQINADGTHTTTKFMQ